MILTTTYAENYGREEIHKALVQMADVAVPANESDVLWRHAKMCIRDRLSAVGSTLITLVVWLGYMALCMVGEVTVSYTHLDVYKRQISFSKYFA